MRDDRESEIPGPAPLLCVDIEIPIDLERTAHVVVAAGEFVWTSPGRARWEEKPAFWYDVYVAARGGGLPDDTLAVPSLGELDRSLRIPRKDWPPSDLQTAITWSPEPPRPGDTVDITIVVSNNGRRAVDRVHVNVLVGPCCPNEELRHDWFPRVGAGESVRLKASVRFPDGFGMVAATARPTQSPKRVVDANEATKRPTVVMIGPPR
jgi:alpha-galactosidase-like protein